MQILINQSYEILTWACNKIKALRDGVAANTARNGTIKWTVVQT